MHLRPRLSFLAIGLFALGALIWACQVQDGSFPTEADRSIQQAATCDAALAAEIRTKINTVITDPIVGKSVTSQFNAIVKACPKNLNDAIAKTKSTTAFILKHFTNKKWTDAVGTGELVAAMYEFVGLSPEAEAATTCLPGADCELIQPSGDVFTGSEIPGEVITQTFVLLVTRLPDDFAPPPLFPIFYEISTIPAGITFPAAPSGSLTLAQADDQAVVAVCTLDENEDAGTPSDAVPGQNLFLAHQQSNGQWETLPFVETTFLDCADAGGETESALWSSPFGQAVASVVDLLSPARANAGGRSTGGAITSFSPYGSEYTDPLPTTTTASIVGGGTTFTVGQSITIRAVVSPIPPADQNPEAVFVVRPVSGGSSPVEPVVGGVSEHTFVCGSTQVPVGSHTAGAAFLGTSGFELSSSGFVLSFQCNAS